jgi:hypothetical protein
MPFGPEAGRANYEQTWFSHGRTSDCFNSLGGLIVRGEMPIKFRDSWFPVKPIWVR